ncbi:MAG: phosphopantetheine-binding protein [Bacteroidaceae bacterium]|nr:phosphopantetheine-binding protein [Bacteroidaceae bacterium]
MTIEEISEKVNTSLAEEFEIEQSLLTPDANIKTTLKLDSLSIIDLVAIVEDTFSIKTDAQEIKKIATLGDLYSYIQSKL